VKVKKTKNRNPYALIEFAELDAHNFEIVSKVILRHANLSTTQRYLGKISDTEATRWIENLYG
jgi:hypothetical protein